jgi:hypothetical protein
MKTGDSDPMNFWPDYQHFELDFYFQLFLYLSTGGGFCRTTNPIDAMWMFPDLAALTGGCSSTVTKWLVDIIKTFQSYGVFTGKSLRVGSVNEIIDHPMCELIHGILRGGWQFSGYCNIFEYIVSSLKSMSIAGRALAGWPNSRCEVFLPKCSSFLDASNVVRVNNLMAHLFNGQVKGMEKDGPLWPLADCMLATVLMHLDNFIIKYPNHLALIRLIEAG